MTARTPDALASALPSTNLKAFDDNGKPISLKVIASVQAERLAEAGYVLVHAAPDEVTVERIERALEEWCNHPEFDPHIDTCADCKRLALAVLAALVDTSAQARRTADDATGGGTS